MNTLREEIGIPAEHRICMEKRDVDTGVIHFRDQAVWCVLEVPKVRWEELLCAILAIVCPHDTAAFFVDAKINIGKCGPVGGRFFPEFER